MRFNPIQTAPARMARSSRQLLGSIVCITTLSGAMLSLVGLQAASAATGLSIPSQSPSAVLSTGTAVYNPIVWSGGTAGDFVALSVTAGLPSGATFSDSSDGTNGCATESGSGGFTFTHASVATSSVALGTYTLTVKATEYSDSVCTTTPTGATASGTASLVVAFTPTLTASGPSIAGTGTTIPITSITSTLASASTSPAATGAITFTVFGPQATAPVTCTSGGMTVGTASVIGNGIYSPSSGFTPPLVGDYWWYASYAGDTNDIGATSACGANMSETVVSQGPPPITWAAPAPITYGTPLSATQLDATTGVAGTFTYTPAIGAMLGAGINTLTVVFTPTDLVDYATSTATVSLTVTPMLLQVTASSTTMGHGGAPPTVTPSYAGFVNGDTSSSLSVQPTCTTTANASTSVGVDTGANVCSGAVDANYTINYVPGNVTVVAPVLTISSTSLVIKSSKKTTVALGCSSAACEGTISITFRPGTRMLGSESYVMAAGARADETVSLNSAGRHKLDDASKSHPLRVVMKITLAAGLTHEETLKVT